MLRNSLVLCLVLCSALLFVWLNMSQLAVSQDADAEIKMQVRWTKLTVRLKGDDGQAVANAAVMPYAMRMVETEGHGYWATDTLGAPKYHFSDGEGVAVIDYPARMESKFAPKGFTTKLITFQISHSDYVQQVVHCDLVDPANPLLETEVTLQKGCEVQLGTVDSNNQRINDFAVLMAGPSAPDIWADDGKGGKRSSAVKPGMWQTLLVKPQPDGRTLFSGVLPLRVRENQLVSIRNVRLTPGAEVRGQLAAEVPRPVTQGFAILCALPKPDGDSWAEDSPSITWNDYVPIAEDGSFHFASVPKSGELQIIAVCDGWVSKTTIPEAQSFVMGQLFAVQESSVTINVEMERTGSLELTFIKPDGQPLESGSVGSSPNQRYYKGGSTLLGQRYRSLAMVENLLLPINERMNNWFENPSKDFPYLNQSVENGRTTLRGLPVGKRARVHLAHAEYRIAGQDDFGEAVHLPSSEPVQHTIHLVRHSDPQLKAEVIVNGAMKLLQSLKDRVAPKK